MIEKLFRVALIFKVNDANCPTAYSFDRKLRFLEATSEREAYQKALLTATRDLERLNNSRRKNVSWEFVGIEAFQAIKQKASDDELFYTIDNDEDAFEYMRQLRLKTDSIQTKIAQFA